MGIGVGDRDDRGIAVGSNRAFVVRVRMTGNGIEPDDRSSVLRGSVELVNGQMIRYFTSIDEMAAIVRDVLFPARPGIPTPNPGDPTND